MKNILKCMIFVVGVFFVTNAFASNTAGPYNVSAKVVVVNGITAQISKIVGDPGVWPAAGTPSETSMAFGDLTYDFTNGIYKPNCYFAVDLTIFGGASWSVTHSTSGMGALANKFNVAFYKKPANGTDEVLIAKKSFATSNGYIVNRSSVVTATNPGWLRIYYGAATGNKTVGKEDSADCTVIDSTTPAQSVSGTVTITLTP